MEVRGYANYRVWKKLCVIKHYIKSWNKEVFGRIEDSKEAFSIVMEDLDKVGENRELSPKEVAAKQRAVKRIWSLNCMRKYLRGKNPGSLD